jgi:AcrR family transcriptional regulator
MTDRRVQRTRELLQNALIDLISERGYDAITIQEIVDRANVGRTTFYLHFNSKEDLFVSCHEAIVSQFQFGPLWPLSREELLAPEPPAGMVSAYRHLHEARKLLYPIFQGKDSTLILRRIRDFSAQEIEANLRAVFNESESAMPFTLLANTLAGAQIAMIHWWLERHQPYTAEDLALAYHRLQRVSICDALGITEIKSTLG